MQGSDDDDQMDRKRRLTALTSPGRRDGPARAESSSSRGHAMPLIDTNLTRELPGTSRSSAIDLTGDDHERPLPPSPPAPPPPAHSLPRTTRPTVPTVSRRQSEVVLPRWQPDADVSECPVCHNTFTFWYRKHHCRKCGRVVCANCSPHRITIPRQFIVRQPEPPGGIMDLTGDDSTSPMENRPPQQQWGGEEVRVCNPCVPDPNLDPPPQYRQPQLQNMHPQRSPDMIPPQNWRFTQDVAPPGSGPLAQYRRHRNSSGPLPPLPPPPPGLRPSLTGHRQTVSDASAMHRLHEAQQSMVSSDAYHRHRARLESLGQNAPPSLRDLYAPTMPQPGAMYYPPPRISSAAPAGTFGTSAPTNLPAPARSYHHRSMLDVDTEPAAAPPPPAPRRQIAEEDECPICREELPPTGPNGETADRERHIEECIASHLYTSTPPSRTASAPPAPDIVEGSSSSAAMPTPIPGLTRTGSGVSATPSGSMASGSAPLRQRRMTGGRMLVYKATEKDCVGEDGEVAECVICFEEFETGDEMGRLECLCRFHRGCIRKWWDTKGMGSCPTHQLHD